jgi:hypothetical protein
MNGHQVCGLTTAFRRGITDWILRVEDLRPTTGCERGVTGELLALTASLGQNSSSENVNR